MKPPHVRWPQGEATATRWVRAGELAGRHLTGELIFEISVLAVCQQLLG